MCVSKDNLLNQEKEASLNMEVAVTAAATVPVAPTNNNQHSNSNWTQLFRKPLKPKLTRKIVSSAKTNLNKYWNKFEEMLASDSVNATNKFNSNCTTRTSYRLMPPMLSRNRSSYAAPPSPPPSPIISSIPIDFVNIDQNNIHEEINQLISKQFTVEKNVARSSMYKHFSDESLYHGVNLNVPRQRCSCADVPTIDMSSVSESNKYSFHHRNLSMSFEDQENLDNEAMEVYTNFGYDISF